MKVSLTLLMSVLVLAAFAMVGAEEPAPWFDLEKCAFCKQLGAEEGLIDHMHAEYHSISDGILWVMSVDGEYKAAFDRAQMAMQNVGMEIQKSGEMPYMCRHCASYGEFMMAGVIPECVASGVGQICMMTSSDPEMVKKLQAFGQTNAEEMAKFHASREKK